ncbi:RsmG family class I SAM-dependent methyltransferase [Sphingomonas sp.]|uniref:16S rRNA (guanine(527)-N(7))-methyltransferase RsmG n=1 Tax=Sphingomonas sp. TaxID=28214 RepID=UPI0025DA01D2|nr:RsmG family class I SAM-dependent methyltransferase [Sphingomonas sp.]
MERAELCRAAGVDVSRETFALLVGLVDQVAAESIKQNLISRRTLSDIWNRHIVDSLQLLKFSVVGPWLDLGTGAGFPGLVIAACGIENVVLVEERRLRYEFLNRVVRSLGLTNVCVEGANIERVKPFPAATISARAFAPLEKTLSLAHGFSSAATLWILPKGRTAAEELASAKHTWHGKFRLEPSMTDPTSSIIVANNISRRGLL